MHGAISYWILLVARLALVGGSPPLRKPNFLFRLVSHLSKIDTDE